MANHMEEKMENEMETMMTLLGGETVRYRHRPAPGPCRQGERLAFQNLIISPKP